MLVTKPYGGVEQDDFVNGAVALRTLLTPHELLDRLHEIEVYEDADLIIPHADMANRSFVLAPLAELCPNYRHPLLGKTVAELAAALERTDA